jgi:hypothetical protein
VAESIGGAWIAVAIDLEIRSIEHAVEELDLVAGKNIVGRLGWLQRSRRLRQEGLERFLASGFASLRHPLWAIEETLVGSHGAMRAITIADAAFLENGDLSARDRPRGPAHRCT